VIPSRSKSSNLVGHVSHGLLLCRDDVLRVSVDITGPLEEEFQVSRDAAWTPRDPDVAVVSFLSYVPRGQRLHRVCRALALA